jgi:hypothetical protein
MRLGSPCVWHALRSINLYEELTSLIYVPYCDIILKIVTISNCDTLIVIITGFSLSLYPFCDDILLS